MKNQLKMRFIKGNDLKLFQVQLLSFFIFQSVDQFKYSKTPQPESGWSNSFLPINSVSEIKLRESNEVLRAINLKFIIEI